MKTDELRERFLLFRDQGLRPSPQRRRPIGDKTVLFTPAGMNQFETSFWGSASSIHRATTCQKCRGQATSTMSGTPPTTIHF
jgi:alanyl-tRNA synthetase